MIKLLPYYRFRSREDASAAINLIYDQGWFVGVGLTREQALRYPWPQDIRLISGAFWSGNRCKSYNMTLVNSPRHLIAYCRTLGDRAPNLRP